MKQIDLLDAILSHDLGDTLMQEMLKRFPNFFFSPNAKGFPARQGKYSLHDGMQATQRVMATGFTGVCIIFEQPFCVD
jgi:hypothetical protein